MVKFLIRISIFLAVLLLFKLVQLGVVWSNLNANDSSNFYGVNTTEKRIILVGSSNLDFNYDYKKLNSSFEGYNVIGCNLNEPSGLYATLHKLKKLNPGRYDIIIFCLPYSLYKSDKLIPLGSSGKKGFSAEVVRNSFTDFPFYFLKSVIDIKTSDTFKLLRNKGAKNASSTAITFTLETEADSLSDFLECKKLNGQFDISSVGFEEDYLVELHEYIKNSFPSRIFYRFPPVKELEFYIDQERLDYLDSHFDFINDFKDAIYTDQYWYNQWYHLNYCGREINTDELRGELKARIN